MLAPIKARVASSFSKNGIHEVATETICFGEISIKSTSVSYTHLLKKVSKTALLKLLSILPSARTSLLLVKKSKNIENLFTNPVSYTHLYLATNEPKFPSTPLITILLIVHTSTCENYIMNIFIK